MNNPYLNKAVANSSVVSEYVPKVYEVLKELDEEAFNDWALDNCDIVLFLEDITNEMPDADSWQDALDSLYRTLRNYAPPSYYFGAKIGNPEEVGYWKFPDVS